MDTEELMPWTASVPQGWQEQQPRGPYKMDGSLTVPLDSTTDRQLREAQERGYYLAYTDAGHTWHGRIVRRKVAGQEARYDLVLTDAKNRELDKSHTF